MVRAGVVFVALLPVAGAVLIYAQNPAPPEVPTSEETIRTRVDVVMAPVTVLNRQGGYVSGLQPQDFHLLDNGKEQDIHVDVTFQPISMVIAVQANDHVEGILPKINKIGSMIQPMVTGEQGEVAVLAFDHRFQLKQNFTNDPGKIEAAIKSITPGSSSSRMIDAVIESVRMLRSRPSSRRRILLLIAETRDKGSEGRVRDALTDIQINNVSVYSVDVSRMLAGFSKTRPPDTRPDTLPPAMTPLPAGVPATPNNVMQATGGQGGSAQFVPLMVEIFKDSKAIFVDNPVEVFTKGTGGAEFGFGKQRGLEDAIEKVGAEIHSQYLITYNPNNKDQGGFHEIEVEVSHPEANKVRTRPGYWLASVPK